MVDFLKKSEKWQFLSRENLLTDFELKNLDSTIDFDSVDAEIYAV